MQENKQNGMSKKGDDRPPISEVIDEKDKRLQGEKYNQYVKSVTPKHNLVANVGKAFLIGGIVCTIGQGFLNWYMNMGADKENAGLYTTITLIAISVILTGLNLYSRLAKFGGGGTVVPITGFANSVASAAIDFKAEGQVFGIGCKIFTIAGPVILYGILSSWILGVIYYIWKLLFA